MDGREFCLSERTSFIQPPAKGHALDSGYNDIFWSDIYQSCFCRDFAFSNDTFYTCQADKGYYVQWDGDEQYSPAINILLLKSILMFVISTTINNVDLYSVKNTDQSSPFERLPLNMSGCGYPCKHSSKEHPKPAMKRRPIVDFK